ncbi:glycosyltransferase family 2 protein [Methylobacterium brachiatum]|uniref:Glycosyltransferase family 2 protein n=1 Tax=Methylobacterium brachiatum TaxID=269660 RepID=A0ABV1R6R2_9HYPH
MTDAKRRENESSDRPFFSIIITCYNYDKYIEAAIESALSQSFHDYEIVVVDDGSEDFSWSIIQKYKPRVKAYCIENRGSVGACLFGLSMSAGRYVLFLDADDLLRDNLLIEAHWRLKDSDVTKMQFLIQPIDGVGGALGDPFPGVDPTFDSAQCINSISTRGYYDTPPTSGNIYRRDVYENLGSIEYDFGIDGVAYLLAPFIGEVIHVPLVLAEYRMHGQNRSLAGSNSKRFFRRNVRVFKRRLMHLNLLLTERNFDKILIRKQYHYTAKNLIMSFLAENKRPPIKLSRNYIALSNERRNFVRRSVSLAFIVSVHILPIFITNYIISIRQDQGRRSKARAFVKRLSSGKLFT